VTPVGPAPVGTEEQATGRQLDELRAAGCAEVFEERASCGDRARPVLAQALARVGPGDTLVVALDRPASSLPTPPPRCAASPSGWSAARATPRGYPDHGDDPRQNLTQGVVLTPVASKSALAWGPSPARDTSGLQGRVGARLEECGHSYSARRNVRL
jgi:resolvase-like protein